MQAENIPGWFSPEDASLYVATTRLIGAGRLVEVGTWLGRSLAFVLPVALAQHAQVWAVDHWRGSPSDETSDLASRQDVYAEFVSNMKQLGYWEKFAVLRMSGSEAAKQFADDSLDLVFLDAEHTYQAVASDIAQWWPKVKRGGYMLGHDYGWSGVAQAVNERWGAAEHTSGQTWRVRKA